MSLAHALLFIVPMKDKENDEPDAKGAMEEDVSRIETIKGSEVLGYAGDARGEHSGQNEPVKKTSELAELADNKPEQIR